MAELGKFDESLLRRLTTSASIRVRGTVVPSPGKGQKMDLKAESIEILGDCDAEAYPLQPKKAQPGISPGKGSPAVPDQHVWRRVPASGMPWPLPFTSFQ